MARSHCDACNRPTKTCLCDVIVTRRCAYELIILQDPKEARHALSSAPLLQRSIQDSRLVVGEYFQPEALLGPDWRKQCLLIFPGENPLSAAQARQRQFSQILLLDGSWRKVRRLLHLNPWLTELPCLAISPSAPSQYRIRKSPRSDGLSTIEAAVAALNALDHSSNYSDILAAFDRMIDYQITAMGAATFRKNYPA